MNEETKQKLLNKYDELTKRAREYSAVARHITISPNPVGSSDNDVCRSIANLNRSALIAKKQACKIWDRVYP